VGGGEGSERFLVVASREPLTEFETDLAALPRPTASELQYAELSGASTRRLRSVADLIGDDTLPGSTEVFDRMERLGTGYDRSSGVWVTHIRLRSR
jgi:hypothetical protein